MVFELTPQPSNEASTVNAAMDDVTFEIPTFDPDGPGIDDDYNYDLPDPPMEPPPYVQQQLNASGDNLQNLAGDLRQAELNAQKKRLVDSFYNEVSHTYGLQPEGRIDYRQFGIDADGKTLYWTPEDKKISVAAMRGGYRFLALATLARRYRAGGTYALRRSLGLPGYRSGLGKETVETLQNAEETLPKNIESIKLKDLPDQRRHRDNRRCRDHVVVHQGPANGHRVDIPGHQRSGWVKKGNDWSEGRTSE